MRRTPQTLLVLALLIAASGLAPSAAAISVGPPGCDPHCIDTDDGPDPGSSCRPMCFLPVGGENGLDEGLPPCAPNC